MFDIEQYSGIETVMLSSRFDYADCLALLFLS